MTEVRSPALREVCGRAAAPGSYTGPARVIRAATDYARIRKGDVLVCGTSARDVWLPLSRAGALVFEAAGVLSNPAIVARECGIPAVVAAAHAAAIIRDGEQVLVDGDRGVVRTVA